MSGSMSLQHEAAIRRIVQGVLKERFGNVKIFAINIVEDVDEDDERILKIDVVFEAKGKLDAAKLSGLTRSVLPRLAKVKENGFPIFSFISKADWGKLSAEAS